MKVVRIKGAFTLIELLVVISIIGLLAALTVPAIRSFGRADAMQAASQQMLADVGRARQLAISQRTTVYMVFLPTNFWNDLSYTGNGNLFNALLSNLPQSEQNKLKYIYDKQLNSYALVSLRSAGDQPAAGYPRYLISWKSLPEGTFVAPGKFGPRNQFIRFTDVRGQVLFNDGVFGFNVTNNIPFPSEDAVLMSVQLNNRYLGLPYVAFNYLGQLISDTDNNGNYRDAYIPLARGTIAHAYDPNKVPLQQPPTVVERPLGNSLTNYNVIHIDWLTGRAKAEHPEVQ